jgi:D-alanyl-D-alanine carboxypeptidase (penicillin-binding protein 5/6)
MVTLYTQNTMLSSFRGDLGGKIGWTTPARATFIGWARRGGTTLVVTILHCTPLTELTYATRLLRWGFAMDGTVRPVGHLASPLPTVAAVHHGAVHRSALHHGAARPQPAPGKRSLAQPGSELPGLPLTAGLAALLLAVLVSSAVMIFSGRRRRAGNPPGR